MRARRNPISTSWQRIVAGQRSDTQLTEALPVVDDAYAMRVLDFATRVAETMLATGAPASELTTTVVRIADTYGLQRVHVDVTYNSITVAHHRSGPEHPITLMRVVRGPVPDHEKLRELQALVTDVRDGMPLERAAERYREIRRRPFRYRPAFVIGAQSLLAVGVSLMLGADPLTVVLAFIAAAVATSAQYGLSRARVPFFFSQVAGGFLLTLVATAAPPLLAMAGVAQATHVRPSVIVASVIVIMLAGLTIVGAAQDAIDGFTLTALGRILELVVLILGVVLGILLGLEVTRVLDLGVAAPDAVIPLGPVPLQFAGAALIAMSVALMNGAGALIVAISGGLSVVAWTGYLAAVGLGLDVAVASGAGAFLGSFVGVVVAYRVHVPAIAITTAAILPMIPAAAVFRGLLSVVESGSDATLLLSGFSILASAGIIGVSLAVGASLGIYLGQPVRASLGSVIRARAHTRRWRRS